MIEPKDSRVSIISTHEQLLDGQVYNGCINPASAQYRAKIMDMVRLDAAFLKLAFVSSNTKYFIQGMSVGKMLATRGVIGHFSVDFLANKNPDGTWDVHAVEINLRQGGTTHPHTMMALLVGGCICSDGLFRANDGSIRTYIATDTYFNPKLRGCNEDRLVDAIQCKENILANKIRWNKSDGTGVTFHLFKFVEKHGRIGFTAIGRTREEAQSLYDEAIQFLQYVGDKNVQA